MEKKKEIVILKCGTGGEFNEKEREAYVNKFSYELLVMIKPVWRAKGLKLMIPITKEYLKKMRDGDREVVNDLAHTIEENEGLGFYTLGMQNIGGGNAKELGSIELRGDSSILKLKD